MVANQLTESCPELPGHDEGPPDYSRSILCCKDWDGRSFGYCHTYSAELAETSDIHEPPIPRPRISLTMNSSCHVRVKPLAMGVAIKTSPVMKMVPRRPKNRLRGSESQHPQPADAR